MTVRPAAGLSRIGLRTADGGFFPLMLESFRGVRQLTLTTVTPEQRSAAVELFLEEPGGGDRYHHLGTVRVGGTASADPGRPDLLLRVALDTGRVLSAVLAGPGGRAELRVALKRYSAGETTLHQAPALADARALITAGYLHDPAGDAQLDPAAALQHDAERGAPVELFVHRTTSTTPLNVAPYDLPRILALAERDDLRPTEVELLRSIYRRLAQDRDPERTRFAAAGMSALEARPSFHPQPAGAGRSGDSARAARDGQAGDGDPVIGEAGAAFARREYGRTLASLHAAHQAGAASAEQAALIDYWLRG